MNGDEAHTPTELQAHILLANKLRLSKVLDGLRLAGAALSSASSHRHSRGSLPLADVLTWALSTTAERLLGDSQATGMGGGFVGLYIPDGLLDGGPSRAVGSGKTGSGESKEEDPVYTIYAHRAVWTRFVDESSKAGPLPGILSKYPLLSLPGSVESQVSKAGQTAHGFGTVTEAQLRAQCDKLAVEDGWSVATLPLEYTKSRAKELVGFIVLLRPLPPKLIQATPLPEDLGEMLADVLHQWTNMILESLRQSSSKLEIPTSKKELASVVHHSACIFSAIFHSNIMLKLRDQSEFAAKAISCPDVVDYALVPFISIDPAFDGTRSRLGNLSGDELGQVLRALLAYGREGVARRALVSTTTVIVAKAPDGPLDSSTVRSGQLLTIIPIHHASIAEGSSLSSAGRATETPAMLLCVLRPISGQEDAGLDDHFSCPSPELGAYVKVRYTNLFSTQWLTAQPGDLHHAIIPLSSTLLESVANESSQWSTISQVLSQAFSEWIHDHRIAEKDSSRLGLRYSNQDHIGMAALVQRRASMTAEQAVVWGLSSVEQEAEYPSRLQFESDSRMLVTTLTTDPTRAKLLWPMRLAQQAVSTANDLAEYRIPCEEPFYVAETLARLAQNLNLVRCLARLALVLTGPTWSLTVDDENLENSRKVPTKLWLRDGEHAVAFEVAEGKEWDRLNVFSCNLNTPISMATVPRVAALSSGTVVVDETGNDACKCDARTLEALFLSPCDLCYVGGSQQAKIRIEEQSLVTLGSLFIGLSPDGEKDPLREAQRTSGSYVPNGLEFSLWIPLEIPPNLLTGPIERVSGLLQVPLRFVVDARGVQHHSEILQERDLNRFYPAALSGEEVALIGTLRNKMFEYLQRHGAALPELYHSLRHGIVKRPSAPPVSDDKSGSATSSTRKYNTAHDYYFRRER